MSSVRKSERTHFRVLGLLCTYRSTRDTFDVAEESASQVHSKNRFNQNLWCSAVYRVPSMKPDGLACEVFATLFQQCLLAMDALTYKERDMKIETGKLLYSQHMALD